MATTASEAKTEAKAEAKDKEVEENQEHLKYKTWVLKVSIHCEGCKRKVKKILTNIDGVYTTNIDLRQHKVIVTGDVEAHTLIRKLEKNGKHAELWPEKAEHKEKKKAKAKNKEKQQSDQESSEEGSNPAEKETLKVEVTTHDSSKNKEIENGGTAKSVENGVHVVKINEPGSTSKAGGVQFKEPKPEVKQTVTLPVVGHSLAAEKKVGESEGVPEKSGSGSGSGGGGGGKKKKKKGHKGNNNNNAGHSQTQFEVETVGDAPAGPEGPLTHAPSHGPMPTPVNYSPPRHPHGYQYPQAPPHYHASPVYAVSYNTAYPRPSYSTSYYAAPTSHTYAYMHPGTGSELPPSDIDSHPAQLSDSFEIFSDENPNACSIM